MQAKLIGFLSTVAFVGVVAACGPSALPGLPPGSPFAEHPPPGTGPVPDGVAVGDVSDRSALVWFRTNGPAKAMVEWRGDDGVISRSSLIQTTFEHDYTAKVLLSGLRPNQLYRYSVLTAEPEAQDHELQPSGDAGGSFRTAVPPDRHQPVTFVWSGDLGGQQHCRRGVDGYPIFDQVLRASPTFAVLLGDSIYADDRCPSPPNEPGSDFTASTVDQYRAKHRYQREAAALQRLLRSVPVFVMWDDHEVRNNFSGTQDPWMPAGRQALLEYWPIASPADDPTRLYRTIRWGKDVEIFLLDTRQYRSANAEKDGPGKTMLGSAQRQWLLDGLARSDATWKFIVTSVPLSNPKGGTTAVPGNDSWARGADGTGFFTELQSIVHGILTRSIRNIVWLAGDVHYAQVNRYDPDRDGTPDFHEFICGPLSAAPGRPLPPNPDLNPTTLYTDGGFPNFGVIAVEGDALTLTLRDATGAVRFAQTLHASSAAR